MHLAHILVPTDFGGASDRAGDFAVDLAAKLSAKVTLLHCWSVPAVSYAEPLAWPTEGIERAARAALDGEQGRLRARYPHVDARLVQGEAWERILAFAIDESADLIVMGTHGRRGLQRLFLGSVAEKVVRLAPVPVVTVGPSAP